MKNTKTRLLAIAILLLLSAAAGETRASSACMPFTTGGYAQNYNTLAFHQGQHTTPPTPGIDFFETGSPANATYTISTGTSTQTETYSFGVFFGSDRALGEQSSEFFQSTLGGCLVNNSGAAITSFFIGYTGEQWRLGTADANIDRLDFQYSLNATALNNGTWTDVNALDFSSPNNITPGALNGNSAGNRTTFPQTQITPPASIPNGGKIYFRWTPINVPGEDDGLAVDNFLFTAAPLPAHRPPADFDGDLRTDLSIFRRSSGQWWCLTSSGDTVLGASLGSPNSADKIAPGDYTGDGKTDFAIFRPSTATWFIINSDDFTFYTVPFGDSTDLPFPADYDGDGMTDQATFRPSISTWFINRSSGGTATEAFGATGDLPVPADYDGDGKTDIAIYRPSTGEWWMNRSSAGVLVVTFGNSADKPVQGEYTGDGKFDVAIWRPSTGEWFVLRSEDYSYFSAPFGLASDVPSPGDYDGDGKFDLGIFRPSTATWYLQRTVLGTHVQIFGASGDDSVPAAFVP